jgi:type VI protein secretion system component VasF
MTGRKSSRSKAKLRAGSRRLWRGWFAWTLAAAAVALGALLAFGLPHSAQDPSPPFVEVQGAATEGAATETASQTESAGEALTDGADAQGAGGDDSGGLSP